MDGTFIQEQIDSYAGAVKPLPVCYLQRPAFAPIRVTGSPWTESDGEECRSEPFRLKWRRPHSGPDDSASGSDLLHPACVEEDGGDSLNFYI